MTGAVFDNGHLRTDSDMAREMMNALLSDMRGEKSAIPKTNLIEVHDSVWHRLVKSSSVGWCCLLQGENDDLQSRRATAVSEVNDELLQWCY